jgi:hypothetical protein
MKKSKWIIEIFGADDRCWWVMRLRHRKEIAFEPAGSDGIYTRRDSAIRGAKRMAKRLRINAEVE